MKESKKDKAFALFSQGFDPKSPEVKALKLQSSTRYKYHKEWENKGKPETTKNQTRASAVSSTKPNGETIGAIDETRTKPKEQAPEVKPAPEEQTPPTNVEKPPEEPKAEASKEKKVVVIDGVAQTGEELWPEDIPQEQARAEARAKAGAEIVGGVSEVVAPKNKDGKIIGPEQKIATTVAEDGIKCTVLLSLQTLTLYSIAKSTQAQISENGDGELSMGDFLDTCAEDFFRVRGKKLGLINFGGK